MDREEKTVAMCVACLAHRVDVSAAWIKQKTAGKHATTCYCDDDLAFPSITAGVPDAPCPSCKSMTAVMAVEPRVLASVDRYRQLRR